MNEQKQIEEMDEMLDIIAKARYEYANDITDHTENEYIRESLLNAGYRKQTEADSEYKKLYEQLLEDFEHALHYAGKNNNVCNFCEHDCGENGVCKGKENRIECNPKWRGIVYEKPIDDYGFVAINASVTHWMPLPEAPKGE